MRELRIRPNLWGHAIALFFTIVLMILTYWAMFIQNTEKFTTTMYIISLVIFSIGTVIIFKSIQIFIKRPDVILINGQGFEYNPGGVSSGFIPWSNVLEVRRVDVRTEGGNIGGPVWETTLAVKLKVPGDYTKHFNFLMKPLLKINQNLYDADIFMRISSFGKQAKEVETLMMYYAPKSIPKV